MTSFAQKVFAVTGVTGITGRAVARVLLNNGASVALISSNQGSLDELFNSFPRNEQSRIHTFAADMTKRDSAQAAAHSLKEKFGGRLDGLIHLVGGWTGGAPITDTASTDLTKMLDQHVWSTWNAAQAFVPLMKVGKSGRIIAVSHPAASNPVANMAAYETAKAAQEAMLFALNEETKADGIRVNVLQVSSIYDATDKNAKPGKGGVSAQEIAQTIKFLLEETGATISGIRIRMESH
jgi:NAD(P)-dependent dehydrogenase (short-subunit alcohol dehydrogenase family)